jgi:hypothetical protein
MEPESTDPESRVLPPRPRPQTITPPLVLGALLILLGGLLTLDRLGLVDAGGLLRFWPLILIGIGGVLATDRQNAGRRAWGWIWMFLGSWFLLRTFGVVRVGLFELLLPLILLAVGFRIVMQSLRRGRPAAGDPGDANLVAILSETKRTSLDNPFRGGHMTAIMGGCQFDLRQATIAPGETAVIEIYGLMCGHELWVPPSWSVEANVVPIMAGVEDKRLPAALVPGGAMSDSRPPRLVLRGYIMMAGVTIKS